MFNVTSIFKKWRHIYWGKFMPHIYTDLNSNVYIYIYIYIYIYAQEESALKNKTENTPPAPHNMNTTYVK